MKSEFLARSKSSQPSSLMEAVWASFFLRFLPRSSAMSERRFLVYRRHFRLTAEFYEYETTRLFTFMCSEISPKYTLDEARQMGLFSHAQPKSSWQKGGATKRGHSGYCQQSAVSPSVCRLSRDVRDGAVSDPPTNC